MGGFWRLLALGFLAQVACNRGKGVAGDAAFTSVHAIVGGGVGSCSVIVNAQCDYIPFNSNSTIIPIKKKRGTGRQGYLIERARGKQCTQDTS